ncbi:hypothetical protein HID58_076355 [Brassica napus]|uniref:Uncharacterized protein n=1 Tax=Brassica napus TaxID=3708 RepID=A0ABQ7YMI6_BRANA|nr:hypothetical protein HID58_076355 [Brassica napus]
MDRVPRFADQSLGPVMQQASFTREMRQGSFRMGRIEPGWWLPPQVRPFTWTTSIEPGWWLPPQARPFTWTTSSGQGRAILATFSCRKLATCYF